MLRSWLIWLAEQTDWISSRWIAVNWAAASLQRDWPECLRSTGLAMVRLYYIYIILEARAVQSKCESDVGRLLPFCQISFSRWCSFCVAFLTALQWGAIPDLAQGLTIQSPPTRLSSGSRYQQDEFTEDHHFPAHSHSQPPLEAAVCAERLEHIHVYEQLSPIRDFLWSFMLAAQ